MDKKDTNMDTFQRPERNSGDHKQRQGILRLRKSLGSYLRFWQQMVQTILNKQFKFGFQP